jgi:hypothetical protein
MSTTMPYSLATAALATGLNKSTVLRAYPAAEARADGSTDGRSDASQRFALPTSPSLEAEIQAWRCAQ